MLVNCENCNKEFSKRPVDIKRTKHNFCCHSCHTIFMNKNNITKVKKIKNKCIFCNNNVSQNNRKRCDNCISNNIIEDYTIDQIKYDKHHKSSSYALIRTRARILAKILGWVSCRKCGYDKHVEIAHIKPISSYPKNTLISEINSESNLIPLCPNCHWEFDNSK